VVSGRLGTKSLPWQLAPRCLLRRAAAACVVLVGLAACTAGPDYKRPAVPVPAEWRTPAEGVGSLADLAWWQLFEDSALHELVRTALAENKDLNLV